MLCSRMIYCDKSVLESLVLIAILRVRSGTTLFNFLLKAYCWKYNRKKLKVYYKIKFMCNFNPILMLEYAKLLLNIKNKYLTTTIITNFSSVLSGIDVLVRTIKKC